MDFKIYIFLIFFILFFASLLANESEPKESEEDLSRGFGTDIEWVSWTKAITLATELNKPILLLIHKTWCGACQALKKSFNNSSKRKELIELSKNFVMVNTEDDEEPEDELYAPDGQYIPRLFILKKDGEPLSVNNSENFPKNIAYFPQAPDVIRAMKQGLEQLKNGQVSLTNSVVEPVGPPKIDKKIDEMETQQIRNRKDDEMITGKAKEKPESNTDAKSKCPHAAGKKAAKNKSDQASKQEDEKNKKQTKKDSTKKLGNIDADKSDKQTKQDKDSKETKKKKKDKTEL